MDEQTPPADDQAPVAPRATGSDADAPAPAEAVVVEEPGGDPVVETDGLADSGTTVVMSADDLSPTATVAAPADVDPDEVTVPRVEPNEEEVDPTVDDEGYQWFVLKVTSNRERTVKTSLERRIKREGLEELFGEIVIPTQKVIDPKGGKKRVIEQKLFPGYVMIQMKLTDESWYLVRDTTGVGDFTGAAGKPAAMSMEEVQRMLGIQDEEESGEAEPAKVKIDLPVGEVVKIKDGPFESFEGTVEGIDEQHGKVTVLIEIFGRPTPTDLEYWQVEKV